MYLSLAACWFSSRAEKLCAKSKQDFLSWLTWLPGTEELIHIHCVQELTDREKSQFAEHQFAWARPELFASQLPLFLCLNVIWRLVESGKRHRFGASVFFSSFFSSPPVKMPFYFHTWSSGTELLSQWMLSDPSESCHSVFEASRLWIYLCWHYFVTHLARKNCVIDSYCYGEDALFNFLKKQLVQAEYSLQLRLLNCH